MIENALSLREAKKLCAAYQHLVGKEVHGGAGRSVIESVAVVPFDDINKWIFLEYFIEHKDVSKAMDFYKVPYYDVALIVRDKQNKAGYIEIRKHIDDKQGE